MKIESSYSSKTTTVPIMLTIISASVSTAVMKVIRLVGITNLRRLTKK